MRHDRRILGFGLWTLTSLLMPRLIHAEFIDIPGQAAPSSMPSSAPSQPGNGTPTPPTYVDNNPNSLVQNLEIAFSKQQWNEAAEIAFTILQRQPDNAHVRLRGAYALFERGHANAALSLLRRMTPQQWQSLPEGADRLVEVIALFQKKVPLTVLPGRLDQVNIEQASPYLHDEIRFAKGRAAFEKGDFDDAKSQLSQVSKKSRYFGPSSYISGTAAVKSGKYPLAAEEFSKIFEPQIFEQSSEFWQDVATKVSNHWGTSLSVKLDTQVLTKSSRLAELGILALARTSYATKDYFDALKRYDQIPKESSVYQRARLEKVWTLLALNRHDDAQKEAADLAVENNTFEALEARPVRALVLTDAGRTDEARGEIDRFTSFYEDAKAGLTRFRQYSNSTNLPPFLQRDLTRDERLQQIDKYQESLKTEILALRSEDRRLFPVYGTLSQELEPLVTQAREYAAKLTLEHVTRRLADLERLYVQSKLIVAETFLEDREKLRTEFKGAGGDLERQKQHDVKLVQLLSRAVREVDEAMRSVRERHLNLEFRQSELLWELSSATGILSQTTLKAEDREMAEAYRSRSIKIARDIAENFPTFAKHGQAMFFTGFALMEVNEVNDGIAMLNKFVQLYPQHQHVPDAYRILGDLEFDANRFRTAEDYYRKILDFQNSPIVGYSLYKIGWCNYNLHSYAKALMALEQAILWAKALESTDQLLNLKREARRDLISIFAEMGDHRKALEYFDRFLGGDSTSWLAGLAKHYDETGQYEKATDLYRQLLSLDPNDQDKLGYQTAIIHGAYQLRKWEMALEATKELVASYSSLMKQPQPEETPAFAAEKAMNEVVMAQHFEFAKSEVPAEIDRVLAVDKLYLSAFEQWPSSQPPLYQFAHFLLKHKRNEEAVDAFRNHWLRFKDTLKEPLREEALRNFVVALEELEQKRKDGAEKPTKLATELLEYTKEYGLKYASTKHARPIAFLRTVVLFKYKQTDQGITETQAIFDVNQDDDFGKRAFKNLRVAYYDLKDWKRTFEWASILLQRPKLAATPYYADLKTVREESLFLWADNTPDNEAAAQLYLKISTDPQMQRLRDKALYNAFIRYQKADKRIEALQTAVQLEKAAPTFGELPAIAGMRAALYQEAGDYEQAMPLFEAFLKKPPADAKNDIVQQARLNVALIAEGLGRYPQAYQMYQQYLAKVPQGETPPGANTAKVAMERIVAKQNRTPAAQFKKWDVLMGLKTDLDRNPLPKAKDLVAQIQGGAQKVEKVVKQFLDVSADAQTPSQYAFEAYCTVPFLYAAYQRGIRSLGKGQPPELVAELEKLAAPLDIKAREQGIECLKKSDEALHDGSAYRQVLFLWGWQSDDRKAGLVDKLTKSMERHAPWIDQGTVNLTEPQILTSHLQNQATPESWYALARLRFDFKRFGLSRLTLLDALARNPNNGRILNALAVIEHVNGADPVTLNALYEKAATAGSPLAFANLGFVHLRGARLDRALEALVSANNGGAFAKTPEIQSLIAELTKPPPPLNVMEAPKEDEAKSEGAKTE